MRSLLGGAAVALLALAALMRLYRPELAVFGGDQAWHLERAWSIARGLDFPTYGLGNSAGLKPPPLYDYLLAPVLLLAGPDPAGASLAMGGLAVAGWAITTWALYRHFGGLAALTGGLLYAGSLWASFFGRIVNGQTLIPVFNALFGWSALEVLRSGSRRHQVLAPVWLSAAVQGHYAALSLLGPAALAFVLARRRLDGRALAVGVLLGLLLAGPYWVGEARSGLEQTRRLVSASLAGGGEPQLTAWTLAQHVTRVSNLGPSMGHPLGDRFFSEPGWALKLEEAQNLLLLASLAALLWSALRNGPTESGRLRLWVAGWYLMPPLILTRASVELQIHNLLVLYPAAFAVLGAGLGQMSRRMESVGGRRALSAAVVALALVLTGLQAATWPRFLAWLQTGVSPLTGPLWPTWEETGRMGQELARQHPGAELVLALPEELMAPAGFALDPKRQAPTLDAARHLLVHEHQPLLYLTGSEPGGAAELLGGLEAQHLADVPYAAGRQSFEYLLLPPTDWGKMRRRLDLQELDWRLTNGVRLLGYGVGQAGGEVQLVVAWRGSAGEAGAAYSLFMHLLDPEGQALAKADLAAPRPEVWAADRIWLSRASLTLPAGRAPAALSLGMYGWPGLERVGGGASRDPPTATELIIPLPGD